MDRSVLCGYARKAADRINRKLPRRESVCAEEQGVKYFPGRLASKVFFRNVVVKAQSAFHLCHSTPAILIRPGSVRASPVKPEIPPGGENSSAWSNAGIKLMISGDGELSVFWDECLLKDLRL